MKRFIHCVIVTSAISVPVLGQASVLPPGEDAIDAVYQWATEWAVTDACRVTWRLRRDRYAQDRSEIVDTTWFIEETVYRWPDSFRRTVSFDTTTNSREGVVIDPYDDDIVIEGIAPTGEHVRRYAATNRADIMAGPAMVDAIQREAVRAPFLLARWILEHGLLKEDFEAVRSSVDRIEAVSPSTGLSFAFAPFANGWALSRVASVSPDGVEYVRFELSEFGWPDGLPGPIGQVVDLSVRAGDGQYLPGNSIEFVAAQNISCPTDASLRIDTTQGAVQDRRALEQQIAAGVANPSSPVSAINPPSRVSLRDMLFGSGIAMVFAGIGWWYWQRRRAA